jgi:hypothetical protein
MLLFYLMKQAGSLNVRMSLANYPFVKLDSTQEAVHFLKLLLSQTTHC